MVDKAANNMNGTSNVTSKNADKVSVSKKATAWVAKMNREWVAVGNFQIKMLLEEPEFISVVGAPERFEKAVFLKGNLYPVFNSKLFSSKSISKNRRSIGLVIFFNEKTQQAEYGALEFESIPQKVSVSDDMEISKNDIDSKLTSFSKTAFKIKNQEILLLDLDKIFN